MPIIYAKLQTITPAMQNALRGETYVGGMIDGLKFIGKKLADTAREGILKAPKVFRVYYINGKRTMSAVPGEYPANQTGKLRDSIQSITKGQEMRFGASDSAPYAKYLQQTDSPLKKAVWVKMPPRPMLTIAHKKVAPKMQGDMLTSVLRRVGK